MDRGGQAVGRRGVGRPGLRVVAPASTANLGSGFDAVGLALDLPFELSSQEHPDLLECEAAHPAAVAHREAGGRGPLWWRSAIPSGRGLGFSGAARVSGAFLARSAAGEDEETARTGAYEVASRLEGHADNAAASVHGGLVVAVGARVVRVPLGAPLEVVVWSPATETSTRRSRAALPDVVAFDDAVFNVGRSALLVAALAAGDLGALAAATEDRLHQARRLEASPASAGAMAAFDAAGALATWVSGSGPSVAAFATAGQAERLAAAAVPGGTVRRLGVAPAGVEVALFDRDSAP